MEDKYHLVSTLTTPEILIDYDIKLFKMTGRCMTMDAHNFFFKLLEKMEYIDGIKCVFNLEYINSASLRYILSMLKNQLILSEIIWYYMEEDFDIEDKGKMIKEIMNDKYPNIIFKLIRKTK
jgi:hypothetical protein